VLLNEAAGRLAALAYRNRSHYEESGRSHFELDARACEAAAAVLAAALAMALVPGTGMAASASVEGPAAFDARTGQQTTSVYVKARTELFDIADHTKVATEADLGAGIWVQVANGAAPFTPSWHSVQVDDDGNAIAGTEREWGAGEPAGADASVLYLKPAAAQLQADSTYHFWCEVTDSSQPPLTANNEDDPIVVLNAKGYGPNPKEWFDYAEGSEPKPDHWTWRVEGGMVDDAGQPNGVDGKIAKPTILSGSVLGEGVAADRFADAAAAADRRVDVAYNLALTNAPAGKDAFVGLEVAKVKKVDDNGNVIVTDEDAVDDNGDLLYSFKINGKEAGQFNANSTLDDVINTMNSSSDSSVKVGYSKLTNNLTFTAKDTGTNSEISFEGLSAKLFGDPKANDTYKAGQDAIFEATVNGTSLGEITRSYNSVEMDGMTITLKGAFGYAAQKDADGNDLLDENGNIVFDFTKKVNTEPVTFETSSDADKIVDVVKQMVEDYNAMVTEIKNAYSTLPAQRSNGAYYEPLTEEDEEGLTESAIKNWTEKAKEGILFGDRDLATLYQRLTSAVSITGEHGDALRAAGITVSYSNGLSTLEFNETKFRDALNKDTDAVRDAFTASTEGGAKSNGLMQALKQPLDLYGKTSGGKGVLVDKAGSPFAPSTMYNNTIQKELDNIDKQIESWQDKMTDKVDYYTNQFSRLEQLILQMNSQSSYFSQLMGG